MSFAKNLKCRECGRVYPLDPLHVCEFCFGPLEVFYDYEALARTLTRERIERGPLTMWRYADLLPCAAERVVDIGTGYTPLLRAAHLGRLLGLERLYIKNDCQNPTGSFKDRGMTEAVSKAREERSRAIICASTGNTSASAAAYGARAGLAVYVVVPEGKIALGKLSQALIHGARIIQVKGNFDQALKIVRDISSKYPATLV
ncbi:hypothetical protein LCGC14_3071200, partial [marine sediment metagenome]